MGRSIWSAPSPPRPSPRLRGASFSASWRPIVGAAGLGMVTEFLTLRRLYARDHLDQVLATFGLILFFNEAVKILWGTAGDLHGDARRRCRGPSRLFPDAGYPSYRLAIIGVGLAGRGVSAVPDRQHAYGHADPRRCHQPRDGRRSWGVNIARLYTVVFGLGAALAGTVGGDGRTNPRNRGRHGRAHSDPDIRGHYCRRYRQSVRGALVGARSWSVSSTPTVALFFRACFAHLPRTGDGQTRIGASLSTVAIYLLMAVVLMVRPRGLFQAYGTAD